MNADSSSRGKEPRVRRQGQGITVETRRATEEEIKRMHEAMRRLGFDPPRETPSA